MKKILVIGSEGQLGSELKLLHSNFDKAEFTFTTIESLDVTNQTDLTNQITSDSYSYIINCTAYTAVDKAESDQALADQINHQALKTIGKSASEIGAKVIHVSTDYVFDGTNYKPYTEIDVTSPNSVYGKTKLAGEKALMNANANSIILRTSWLYSMFGNNFVKTMLTLGKERSDLNVIFDQVGSPTFARDLAKVILNIIEKDITFEISFQSGIYHYSNEGVCSWFDFTRTIHEIANITCNVKPIESKDYPTAAPRPHYSVLNKSKIKTVYNVDIPYWKDSLKECIANINQ
ncbi:dTDP-4-dehydrorhamnose reductase [Carboxylicivirga caseinilyticus]|uniref:dTDP-4-dehydrorhamnose reductase n=1 Tax=Carboxylicivirga caseinilyticus TaxID=3417572 RepID=UPI003D33A55C|nr:dTDP-4-dehydrorhamnose reductase [Marinilabiliaceae bacterium A049]